MRKLAVKLIATLCTALGVASVAQAGTYVNNFDTTFDFLNGIPASSWDGVYLNAGDVPNGSGGAGVTSNADINISFPFPGYLYVKSTGGGFSGAQDDGFFLYKIVSGDFDVSMQIASSPFDPQNYHFCGLMARAYTTNGPVWGQPFSTTSTNALENWVNITRFNEFRVGDQIRMATNSTDIQISAPFNSGSANYNSETNDLRWVRITRVGDTFSFYDKTNDFDAWTLETNLSRADLHGIPMQVGIEQALFTPNSSYDLFSSFSLTGPNVNTTPAPPADPTGLSSTVSGCTTRNFAWTPGAGSSGSVVVVRKNAPIIANAVPGFVYNANTNFGSGDELAGGEYVVYSGPASSVTVGGLLGSNNTYYAAVYSYTGSGSSINYGTNPATTIVLGPGTLSSVGFTLTPTNLPVGGAALATVIATYCAGDSYDVSAAPGTVWATGTPSVAVAVNGSVTGVGVGTSTVSATYLGVTGHGSVTVNAPAFADDFSSSHSYITNGLPGTSWDGMYLQPTDLPNGSADVGGTTVLDANVSSNNVLTLTAFGSGWEGGQDNGPFLFKMVPGGDFQASVHITGYTHPAYQFVGLQARAFTGTGAPSGPSFAENHVNWWRFDQFGVTSSSRNTVDSGTAVNDQTDGDAVDYWMLMARVNATNFYFFKKQNQTDPWIPVPSATFVRPDFTNGTPLQVGLAQATYTGNSGTVWFDHFMLDAANISGGTPPSPTTNLNMVYNSANNTMMLTWVPGTNSDGSASTSFVVMRSGAPVSAQPTFGLLSSANSVFGLGTDLGSGNYVVFRGVGNTVTVSGLTPGQIYYAAVYGYSGSGTTKSFNEGGSASGSSAAGHLTNVVFSVSGSIPLGGAGFGVATAQFDNGGSADISSIASVVSTNASIIITTNDVMTGMGLGSTWVQVSAAGYSNWVQATVRNPIFTENFGTTHDYVAAGVTGTAWDGVYAEVTNMPGKTYASAATAIINSAVAETNVLTVTSTDVGWEFAQDDGFFLFKYVLGDFQAAVHVGLDDGVVPATTYNNPGILARLYTRDTNGNIGAPFGGTNGAESWVSWTRFDQFGIGTYARRTLANATTQNPQSGQGDTNLWLLIMRHNGTNFSFYQRVLPTDPWAPSPSATTYSVAAFAGEPVQVGLIACGFDSGVPVKDQFDNFMLDAGPSKMLIQQSGSNVTLSWSALTGGNVLFSPSLSSPNWQPVSGTPTVANGLNSLTIPRTNTAAFYRIAP